MKKNIIFNPPFHALCKSLSCKPLTKVDERFKASLNPMWVTGFTDAEGSFVISITKRPGTKYLSVRALFEIGLNTKDLAILNEIKIFFGVGQVTMRKSKSAASYTVNKINDLKNVIIPHFSKFPLQSQKRVDFEFWAQIVNLMAEKEHLSESGLLKILSLKSALNWGLTEAAKSLTDKKIEARVRPLHLVNPEELKTIDPHWISGFTAGDGSFSIKITKRKYGYQVELRFRITQHIRDAHLLGSIAEYLGAGKVYTRSNKLACDLEISNFADNMNKIIPFFDKYPIKTVKQVDFEDYKKAASIIKNKEHLTSEGLAIIRDLKSNMNNLR